MKIVACIDCTVVLAVPDYIILSTYCPVCRKETEFKTVHFNNFTESGY